MFKKMHLRLGLLAARRIAYAIKVSLADSIVLQAGKILAQYLDRV